MDNAPLLNHATADPRFGVPINNGRASPARYQLQDGGDVGVMPNRWRHDSGWDSSSQNGSAAPMGYGLGGGNEPPGEDESNVRYGPLPTRVLRRNRTQKKVK
jgi:chitin synthase